MEVNAAKLVKLVKIARFKEFAFYHNMNKQIHLFATKLRQIEGLHLFKIFTIYISYDNIDTLFNHLARFHKEADLRELEKLWNEFIRTGDITIQSSENPKLHAN